LRLVRFPRGLVVVLALAALVAAGVLQGNPGVEELTLAFAPALILFGLLVNGRYVGEERILGRRCERATPRPRAAFATRWSHARERALTSLVERAPLSRRGPPRALLPAS
jgi:NhaP-type Na+/H+ or K+/H+ antiporter